MIRILTTTLEVAEVATDVTIEYEFINSAEINLLSTVDEWGNEVTPDNQQAVWDAIDEQECMFTEGGEL